MNRGSTPFTAVRLLLPLAVLLAVLMAVPSAGAAAQSARAGVATRSPLWYEVTVGGSGMRLTCDFCQPARDVGPSFTAAVGAYAGDRLRIGLEGGLWTYGNEEVREHLQQLGLVAHLTPTPGKPIFLIGGFGWSGYRAGEFKYDAPRVTVGAGWQIPAFGKFVVGNTVTLDAAAFATLRSDEVAVLNNVGLSVVRAAVRVGRK